MLRLLFELCNNTNSYEIDYRQIWNNLAQWTRGTNDPFKGYTYREKGVCININGLWMCTKLVKQNSRSGTERGGQEGNKISRNS